MKNTAPRPTVWILWRTDKTKSEKIAAHLNSLGIEACVLAGPLAPLGSHEDDRTGYFVHVRPEREENAMAAVNALAALDPEVR